ncbi:MAG: signal peptide peptidase SppA [Actinobacteria bacterium]|nr:MAG: signal peptide peptidase SppA [Actinomycetota bacterium]
MGREASRPRPARPSRPTTGAPMSDPGTPSTPPAPAEGAQPLQPPQPGAAAQFQPYVHPAPQKRGAKGWIVALVVILGIIAALLFGCIAMVASLMPESGDPLATGDAVAVIHIDGTIAGTGTSLDGVITPEYVIDQLDQAAADDSVKAVLLRVDSPGGTVAASEEIATTVAYFREDTGKPVVVSVGDIDASGAYMVSSQCDLIVANPTSSVGSIGVIMELPNLEKLLDKVGVEFFVMTRGDLKDSGSPFRSVTASDMAYFNEEMDLAYERFIELVATGREMKP